MTHARNRRVNGILATSRTIGDGSMKVKGYIICDPEIRHHEIQPGDEYVILASDGIWDIFSNQQVLNPRCLGVWCLVSGV